MAQKKGGITAFLLYTHFKATELVTFELAVTISMVVNIPKGLFRNRRALYNCPQLHTLKIHIPLPLLRFLC